MRPVIESSQNPKFKAALRLRDSRARRRSGKILIDGLREIQVAYQAGVLLETIFCSASGVASASSQSPWLLWPRDSIQPVADSLFEKLTYGQRMSQALAIAATPDLSLENLRLPDEPLVLVLDRVEKPGNIGAIARTAATAGAHALVLTDPACEVFNPNAIRASLGNLFSLPVAQASAQQFWQWLEGTPIRLVRACVDGSTSMWDCQLTGPLAIALGSEAHGLGPQWQRAEWPAVQIPMITGADSLNLSVSAAVLCYEALRQRRLESFIQAPLRQHTN